MFDDVHLPRREARGPVAGRVRGEVAEEARGAGEPQAERDGEQQREPAPPVTLQLPSETSPGTTDQGAPQHPRAHSQKGSK